MKNIIAVSLSLVFGAGLAHAQQQLLAGWSFTNITPPAADTTVDLDKSDTEPDGLLSGMEGAFFFDGSFGSTDVVTPGGAGIVYNGIDNIGLASNGDILTRPSAQDFQGGGALDDALLITNFAALPLENFVVSITPDAPGSGPQWENWSFSYASKSTDGMTIDWAWSTDGSTWNAIGQDSVFTSDGGGGFSGFGVVSSQLFLQASLGNFGDGEQLTLDNFAVYGEVATDDPSYWAASPVAANGWRNSGEGYGEPGIGWIFDDPWPWIYALGQGDPGDGDWIYIATELSTGRNDFYGYNLDLGFWFWGSSSWGWYYSYLTGNEGWMQFNL